MNRASLVQRLIAGSLFLAAVLVAGCGVKEATPTAAPKAAVTESAIPAWQQRWDQVVTAAKKEGKLTVYGQVSPAQRESLAVFQRKYGIDMEFAVGKGSEIETKWTAEKNAGLNIADIFHVSTGLGPTMKPKGAFAPISPNLILPETQDGKLWLRGEFPFLDADKTMVALSSAYESYTNVNTDMIKEGEIKSYRDFLKPEYKGKLVLFDPTIPSSSLGWVVFVMKDLYGLDGSKEYFRQLAATAPMFTRDAGQELEWVARGKYAIGVGISHSTASEYKARGAPITMIRVSEGGSINCGSDAVELSSTAPHPNAAVVYLNWLFTEEGQIAFTKGSGTPPIRAGLNVEGIDPSRVPLPGEKVYIYGEGHSIFGPEAAKITREIFGDLLK